MASGGYADWEFVDQNTAAQLTLQPGVFFHNGEPLNAERLKWFYERNLGIAEYNPDYVSGIRARIAFIDDLQVVDDLTLRVGMDPPSVNMPEQLGGGNTPVTPRDYIVENGDEFFARNPVGIGPYTFVSFTPDQEMVSERWDDWFFPNPADEGPFTISTETGPRRSPPATSRRSRPGSPPWRRGRSMSPIASARTAPRCSTVRTTTT